MRFMLMASIACSLVLVGCGGTKNSSATNNTAANKAAANTSTAANSSAPAAGADPRAAFLAQCLQQTRSDPDLPQGFDGAGACGCAYDKALAGKPDPVAYMNTPEGTQTTGQALAACMIERGAGADGAKGSAEEAEEEAAEEK